MGTHPRDDLRGAWRLIAVDTNVLVSAHRRDAEAHERAAAAIRNLAESPAPWAIPWPCVHEFLAVVTHPRIFRPPSTIEEASAQVDAWSESPRIVFLAEGHDHWTRLRDLFATSLASGGRVHDARVAAICLTHGVRTLLSADRDFSRFPELSVQNPLVG